MGESNSKWNNWQTTNIKNIQVTPAAQFQKIKDPIKMWAKELNRHFSKKDTQMANKHIKDAQHHSFSEKCKSKPQWCPISRGQKGCSQRPSVTDCVLSDLYPWLLVILAHCLLLETKGKGPADTKSCPEESLYSGLHCLNPSLYGWGIKLIFCLT